MFYDDATTFSTILVKAMLKLEIILTQSYNITTLYSIAFQL